MPFTAWALNAHLRRRKLQRSLARRSRLRKRRRPAKRANGVLDTHNAHVAHAGHGARACHALRHLHGHGEVGLGVARQADHARNVLRDGGGLEGGFVGAAGRRVD